MKSRYLLIVALVFAATACGTERASDLEVGDCLLDPNGEEFTSITTVDCAEPHDLEVYSVFESGSPGYAGVEAEASTRCIADFGDYVGLDYFESELEFDWLQPTEEGWDEGDRQLRCVLYDVEGQMTGSGLGVGR